jgi:hypothetical protein
VRYEDLGAFFVQQPLYRPEPVENAPLRSVLLEDTEQGSRPRPTKEIPVPQELQRHCSWCRRITNWQWYGIPGSAERMGSGLSAIDYLCRNCGKEIFHVYILVSARAGQVFVQKVGQWPKLEISLPPEFEKALGRSKDFYVRGMASRHIGYGVGALGYFRRVIDDTIADMLGVLEAAMVETGADPAAIEKVRQARGGKVFDERVKRAAEAIPPHLKPGGMNPFADLYDHYSIGLHGLSDEECCDIVDAMDEAMKYVYTELKSHTEGAVRYKEAVTKIQQKLRARKEGGPGNVTL